MNRFNKEPGPMRPMGFTLLEVVVTIIILSILLTVLVVAFPRTRSHQELILAQQQIEFFVREAQKRALNEEREEDCLSRVIESEQKYCSDVGVNLNGNTVTLFADIDIDHNRIFEDKVKDYVIQTAKLPGSVVGTGSNDFVFLAVPPTIDLVVNGNPALSEGRIDLRQESESVTLKVGRYGQVERAE